MKKSKKNILIVSMIATLVVTTGHFFLKTETVSKIIVYLMGTYRPLTVEQVDEEVDAIYSLLKQHASTSEEVWQGYDLTKHNIIVFELDDTSGETLNAWSISNEKKTTLEEEQIKNLNAPSIGGFAPLSFDGIESIALSFSKATLPYLNTVMNNNYIYEVATHELYHLYHDPIENYQLLEGEEVERYTVFPKDALPRVYRKMIYDNLVLAYENPTEESLYLGKAKYWNEIWKVEYSSEYNQSKVIDIAEGKARYIQNMLCVDLENDPDISSTIKSMMIKDHNPFDSIDSESYELGYLSGVILDRINPNWKSEISENPERPLELLLENIESIKDEDKVFTSILKKAEKETAKENKIIKSKLSDIDLAQQSIDVPFLRISGDFMNGSFKTSDFIGYDDSVISLNFSAGFQSGKEKIELKDVSVYIMESEDNTYILPLTMKYTIDNGYILFNDTKVSGNVKVQESRDTEGRLVYDME